MDVDKHMEKAFEALHVAAEAVAKVKGVSDCTADNDHDSGEVIFDVTVKGERKRFVLRLEEYEEE